jgi:hypothetical protein
MTPKTGIFYPRRFDTLQTQILRSRGFAASVPPVLSSKCIFQDNGLAEDAVISESKYSMMEGREERRAET